jgi:hypothetical protein
MQPSSRAEMKIRTLLPAAFFLAFILGACGADTPPATADPLFDVYTAVALTLSSQTGSNDSSEAVSVAPTQTLWMIPTQVIPSPTVQALTTPTVSYVSSCYNSAYVSDVTIPDETTLAPGEVYVKTWEVLNSGSCAWATNYYLTYLSGDLMDGSDTTIGQYVAAGELAEISVELTAPESEGTYTGYWILADSGGTAFGTYVYVQIVVSDDAATSTPTPTLEVTATSTPTGTDMPVPTDTPVPTETPTLVVEDSPTAWRRWTWRSARNPT